jgi:IS5 family transposase
MAVAALKKRPLRLIADKGYDSDPLRKRLKEFKIDLIVPQEATGLDR